MSDIEEDRAQLLSLQRLEETYPDMPKGLPIGNDFLFKAMLDTFDEVIALRRELDELYSDIGGPAR